jgi:hypothetical protein
MESKIVVHIPINEYQRLKSIERGIEQIYEANKNMAIRIPSHYNSYEGYFVFFLENEPNFLREEITNIIKQNEDLEKSYKKLKDEKDNLENMVSSYERKHGKL